MLQNRVDPLGNIIHTKARGAWTGTRGLLHNDVKQIVRSYKLQAWLTCKLEFKDRKRVVMSPGKYTELFFLDEATAFSAGHRPCKECRREEHKKFKALWIKGNLAHDFTEKTPIRKIDQLLQDERMNTDKSKVTFEELIDNITAGTFILMNGEPWLVFDNALFKWSPFGYTNRMPLPDNKKVTVLTPRSIMNTFHAGYKPQIDTSLYELQIYHTLENT